MPDDVVLVQFAKAPVAGQVKTRLLPALSPQQAQQLHANMVAHTCRTLCSSGLGAVQLWVSGDTADPLFASCKLLGVSRLQQQCAGDLGQRMADAFRTCLGRYRAVVLVGSDAPAIDADYLQQAVAGLAHAEVVLGPACDGGYVLIALKKFSAALFSGINWGSDTVLQETCAAVAQVGWRYTLLAPVHDIDRPADLRYLPQKLAVEGTV